MGGMGGQGEIMLTPQEPGENQRTGRMGPRPWHQGSTRAGDSAGTEGAECLPSAPPGDGSLQRESAGHRESPDSLPEHLQL